MAGNWWDADVAASNRSGVGATAPTTGGTQNWWAKDVAAGAAGKPAPTAAPQQVPALDAMGNFAGYYVDAGPASQMSYGEQMGNVGQSVWDVAKGVPKGAIGAIPGIPGDIESLARLGLNVAGAPVSRETYLPTSEQITTKLFGEAESPFESFGRFGGGFVGPGLAAKGLKKAGATAADLLIGRATGEGEKLARATEAAGIRLSPANVREEGWRSTLGPTAEISQANQTRINQLASEATGVKVDKVTNEFLQRRSKVLGEQYDHIFGRPITLDKRLAHDMNEVVDFARTLVPAGNVASSHGIKIVQVANSLLRDYVAAGAPANFTIPGRKLQQLRHELSAVVHNSPDGMTRKRAGDMITALDGAIDRFDPMLGSLLGQTNRHYTATSALEKLKSSGGVTGGENVDLEKLGKFLRSGEAHNFGLGTSRHPLEPLGVKGLELHLSRPGTAGGGKPFTLDRAKELLGAAVPAGALDWVTRGGRAIQRKMPTTTEKYKLGPTEKTVRYGGGAVSGTAGAVGQPPEE